MSNNVNDVVISSRIRLARNVDGLPFPPKVNDERATLIARKVYEAVNSLGTFDLHRMKSIKEIDANVLREKHLISADLITDSPSGAVIINDTETISIMINEEDHVREQCILNGINLTEAYRIINEVDDAISKRLKFAFDARLGYLTSCPTNVGTGMRASAMMFLPGLSITRNLENCVNAVSRLNMTIRGEYGEGSGADGYIYQISNQKTLGVSEQEIISSVQASVSHIVEAELMARKQLQSYEETELKDKILRSLGILCHAYVIDTKEFMQLLAMVKLGIYYGYIKCSNPDRLEKLFTDGQPANILNLSGKNLNERERDVLRASYVSKTLKSIIKH